MYQVPGSCEMEETTFNRSTINIHFPITDTLGLDRDLPVLEAVNGAASAVFRLPWYKIRPYPSCVPQRVRPPVYGDSQIIFWVHGNDTGVHRPSFHRVRLVESRWGSHRQYSRPQVPDIHQQIAFWSHRDVAALDLPAARGIETFSRMVTGESQKDFSYASSASVASLQVRVVGMAV